MSLTKDKALRFAVLLPGQGSQYVGMGKLLYEKFPLARELFAEASEVLKFSLSELCFNGDVIELTKTYNAQPALLTISYIMYRLYVKEKKLSPTVMLGHSLGELSALVCSEMISFAEGVALARDRGLYMHECGEKNPGTMLAVITPDFDEISRLCKEISSDGAILEVANYNSESQVVVSGHAAAVEELKRPLKEKNIRSVPLNVSAPFHSSIMRSATDKLRARLRQIRFQPPVVPIISNVSGQLYSSEEDIPEKLAAQVVSPVRWLQSIRWARELGVNLFVEIGPKSVLKNLNKNICNDVCTLSLDIEEDLRKFEAIVGASDA